MYLTLLNGRQSVLFHLKTEHALHGKKMMTLMQFLFILLIQRCNR